MTAVPGTVIAAMVSPGDDTATFATHDAAYGKGGWHTAATETARDVIPSDRLTIGMACWVVDTSAASIWDGAVWNPLTTGGGSGSVTNVSGVSANGFAVLVTTGSTTPVISLATTITGLLKGDGTAASAAVAGTDYLTSTATFTYTAISGLGTIATQNASAVSVTGGTLSGVAIVSSSITTSSASIAGGTITGIILAVGAGGTGATAAPAARTNLGLGSLATQDASAVSITGGTLSGVAVVASAVTTSAVSITGGTITGIILAVGAGGTGATAAPAARTNLGLGTIATQDASAVSLTGGSISGVSLASSSVSITGGTITGVVIAVAAGGTGATTASAARSNLGLGTIATLAAPSGTVVGTSDTQTLTNKRIDRRVVTLTDAATVTPNSDTTDLGILTSLSQTTTFANPTGTPTDGQRLEIRVKSTASQTVSFGSEYRAGDVALPTATKGGSKTEYWAFERNAADTKWDLMATNGTTTGF